MECPLCNGYQEIDIQCQKSDYHGTMVDKGKVMDYYDSYSAYLDIDLLKRNDGYSAFISNYQCPHLFVCNTCGFDIIKLISERSYTDK